LSSPSGAGKTTITKKLSQKYPNIKVSISHTTRKPRPNEIDGVDYYFVSNSEFEELIKKKNFYEHAKIFDNYYGTSKKFVNKLHEQNYDVVFDIDWQGTKKLSQYEELNLIKIFILPPSKEELKKRLIKRNQDNNQIVEKRLQQFENDIKHWSDYDYVVINNDLESCFGQIEKIIENYKKVKMPSI
jgi:guanylate kinase